MPSDFERALLGGIHFGQGYQNQNEIERKFLLDLQERKDKHARAQKEDRQNRISELDKLGGSLEDIEGGLELMADPSSQDEVPNDFEIKIGRALKPEERLQVGAAERFLNRAKTRPRAAAAPKPAKPGRPDVTANAILSRIKALESNFNRTPDDEDELKQLRAVFNRRAGIQSRPDGNTPKTPIEDKSSGAAGFLEGVRNVFRGKTPKPGMKMQGLEVD